MIWEPATGTAAEPLTRGARLHRSGELRERVARGYANLASCTLCPKDCKVNRVEGAAGACLADERLLIGNVQLHFGEEPPLTGVNGAGNIFLSNCPMKCVFCQNWQISQKRQGQFMSAERLAGQMLDLQQKGAHNINFVSPTHYAPQILKALDGAYSRGLNLPIVYNTNAYEYVETLRLVEGVVDIYLPDLKYGEDGLGVHFSKTRKYNSYATLAIEEMYRQVGDLVLDEEGVAKRGLIIRHLIMPGQVEDSLKVLDYIAYFLSPTVHLSLMSQFHPLNRSAQYEEINRTLYRDEYLRVLDRAHSLGFSNIWAQEPESHEYCVPDFSRENVFQFERLWEGK